MPVTSPIAQTFSAARSRSSTSMPRAPIETPSCSSPRPLRPASGRSRRAARSASTFVPSESVKRDARRGCALDADSRADVDPLLAEDVGDDRARLLVHPAEQARAVLDHRHARADAGEELRKLRADRAAAQDGEALRHLVRARRFDVRPVADGVEPVDRRDGRPRAGRDHEPVVLSSSPVDLDDALPCNARRRLARAAHRCPSRKSSWPSRPSRSSSSRATSRRLRPGRSAQDRARGRATTRAPRREASSSSACTRSTSTRRRRAGARRA